MYFVIFSQPFHKRPYPKTDHRAVLGDGGAIKHSFLRPLKLPS